jgi:hypothetical protein
LRSAAHGALLLLALIVRVAYAFCPLFCSGNLSRRAARFAVGADAAFTPPAVCHTLPVWIFLNCMCILV